MTDADLLERFTRTRDQAAFELLLWRHGPMVLGVCQRLLSHEQDAEDAFQATFLVLVRKARSIGKREALASWLYKVAYRIACRARPRAGARSNHAALVASLPAPDQQTEVVWRDLRSVLDGELARLPESHRRAVVLCYLEGKTNAEAAQLLGWPKGTVATRLARARDRLRQSLARRGWTISSTLLATLLAEKAVPATLPAEVVQVGLRSAVAYASGQTAAGTIPAQALALTEGVLRAMFYGKVKSVTAVLLALLLVGTGIGLAMREAWAAPHPEDSAAQAPRNPPPPDGRPQGNDKGEIDRLRREVATLRSELEQARKEIKDLRDAVRPGNILPTKGPLYRGKPVAFWLEQAKDGDPEYRYDAVTALGMLGFQNKKLIPDLLAPLLTALRENRYKVSQSAASALAFFRGPAVPGLMEVANDKTLGNARAMAIRALGQMGAEAKAAVPVLLAAMKADEPEYVRGPAITALGGIGAEAKAAVPALIQALKADEFGFPELAARALEGIGPEAKAALPALIELLGQRVAEIQKKADVARAQNMGPDALPASETRLIIAVTEAIQKLDPSTRDLLPRKTWATPDFESWQEIYRVLKKR